MTHQKPPKDPVDHVRQRLTKALAGRYVIEGQGGWGGMALVFKARDLRHTRMVAIKVVRPELVTTSVALRFLDEVRMAARLQHPHIVPVYDSGEADGLVYFVMPYIRGETLHERLNHADALTVAEALAVTRDVADALSAAHEAGIIHRDIKPENILLSGSHALVADFGVALAVGRRRGEGHTDPGYAVGTYAYMSPEQASTGSGVDERTDVYALACVLYEMLAGRTPWPDIKDRLYGGLTMREMPPIGREDVPAAIEQAIARALAFRPADRFVTVGDFTEALGLSGVQRGTLPPPRGRIPTWLTAAAALMISAGAVTVGLAMGTGADSGRYVVAPCTGDTALVGGEYCQWRLAEALEQWDAVRLVDPFEAVDVLRRSGLDRADSYSWYAVAQDARAGRLVRADLTRVGDTTFLDGQLLDGSRRRPVGGSQRVVLSIGDVTHADAFASLVGGLLGLGDATREPGILGTRTLAAGKAYAEGRAALAAGDLEAARHRFAEAARGDPTFGDAAFWQAQLGAWLGQPRMEFQLPAERAYAFRASLRDPLAQQLAQTLAELANQAYDTACEGYRAIARADSAGFAAWLGLADCLLRDPIVVPSRQSPSGYVFRASFEEARRAMQAALVREPGLIGAMWPRLERVLMTSTNTLRGGRPAANSAERMAAWPDLVADTAHFIPYPLTTIATGDVSPRVRGDALLRLNRRLLRALADEWVAAYPRDPAARSARAEVLEDLALEEPTEAALGAVLTALREAREGGASGPVVAAAEARLLFRLGRYVEAADAAATVRAESDADWAVVAGMAALGGRAGAAADAYARVAGPSRLMPHEAHVVRLRLDAYAGVGAPADSIRALLSRLTNLVEQSVPPSTQPQVEAEFLEYLRLLAAPAIGVAASRPHGSAGMGAGRWLIQLHEGDLAAARAAIRTLQDRRRDGSRGVAPITWANFWALAMAGDTAGAIGGLDIMLARLPSIARPLFAHPADAAAVARAMTLRAELADAVGDRPTAARWARAARDLWRHADPAARASIAHLDPMIQDRNRR